VDPETALALAKQHLEANNREEAHQALIDYQVWRKGCGLEPKDGDARHAELKQQFDDKDRNMEWK
jgi:hypothetical protein